MDKILLAENKSLNGFPADGMTTVVTDAHKKYNFTHILSGATVFGKALLPRIAAKLNVSPISEVIEIKSQDTFVRTIYAGSFLINLITKNQTENFSK